MVAQLAPPLGRGGPAQLACCCWLHSRCLCGRMGPRGVVACSHLCSAPGSMWTGRHSHLRLLDCPWLGNQSRHAATARHEDDALNALPGLPLGHLFNDGAESRQVRPAWQLLHICRLQERHREQKRSCLPSLVVHHGVKSAWSTRVAPPQSGRYAEVHPAVCSAR